MLSSQNVALTKCRHKCICGQCLQFIEKLGIRGQQLPAQKADSREFLIFTEWGTTLLPCAIVENLA